ncbi:MFS transporter [Bifidobacterium sp. SMB2]|uniref:MFS transporter n=1 Tax=Bifidobacterium saimiriisciurei TaxID=2661627 RepID=A0ABX0CDP0_9BIFI|nr:MULTISPECIES: MFS transporter [Bifidobacterium]NEG95637.1 MFS transporter [Bifidobacterium sp. SMB2]NEH11950.1 MFS transporter [Bifidobacterium saimiriisciurei]
MGNLLLAVIYVAFISLGLPDAVLGSAWPVMYHQFAVPVSYAGVVSMIISAGTIVSSLMSDRLTLKLGAGRITAISVAMTAVSLGGFSFSSQFWMLCLWAIPYGLGAGGVDAALNNYVALHYASRHMSWLHCMWGLGATAGPYIMGFALTRDFGWNNGYRWISILQIVLTALIVLSLPLWKARSGVSAAAADAAGDGAGETAAADAERKPLGLFGVLAIPGAKSILIMFFCYCGLELTTGLWAASYMVLNRGVDADRAAAWASLFYLGITAGRAISGFMTMRFDDPTMIRIGQAIIALGVIVIALPFGGTMTPLVGLILIGLGCAPTYPCMIHSTPTYFGADKSQAIIGVQMATAYLGSLSAPPLFGLIANHVSIGLFPVYLGVILVLMVLMHENLRRVHAHQSENSRKLPATAKKRGSVGTE